MDTKPLIGKKKCWGLGIRANGGTDGPLELQCL
jgi:hypothetical protein